MGKERERREDKKKKRMRGGDGVISLVSENGI